MKLSNLQLLLEELLDEGRFEDAQKKHPEAAEQLSQLKAAGVDSKYAQWFGKHWSKLSSWYKEDLSVERIVFLFKTYDDLLKKKLIKEPENRDINQFSMWEFWENYVEDMINRRNRIEQKKKKASDINTVYNDEQYLIIHPNTTEASCKYGKGTKWCISAKEANQFQNYTNQGATFYFIINKKTNDKDALVVHPSDEQTPPMVFDAQDNEYELDWLFAKYPKSLHKIFYHLTGKPELFHKIDELLNNPQAVINALQPTNVAMTKFYFEMLESTNKETVIRFFAKLLKQIEPSNMSKQEEEFVDVASWHFDNENVSLQTLWDAFQASKKFNALEFQWNDPMSIEMFAWWVKKLNTFDTVENLLTAMSNFIEMNNTYASVSKDKLGDIMSRIIATANKSPELIYQAYITDPNTFKQFTLHGLDMWQQWSEGKSFALWAGAILARKYNLNRAVATGFINNLPTLWKVYNNLPQESREKQFVNILPLIGMGKVQVHKDDLAQTNTSILFKLLQKSQGDRSVLLGDDFAAKNESRSYQQNLKLLREEMKRFFPNLIND